MENECKIDKSDASQMRMIGEDKKCGKFPTLLPAAISAMKEVRLMTEEQVQAAADAGVLNAEATAKDLKAFRTGATPEPKTPKTPKAPKASTVIEGSSVELLDMSPEEVTTALYEMTDVIPDDIKASASDHNDPEFFAAKSLAMEHDAINKSMSSLGKRDQDRVAAAVVNVVQHNQKVFDYVLKKEKPKKIKALEERLKKKIAEVDELKRKLVKGQVSMNEHGLQVMLRADFKRFLGALHPDKHPGQEEKYQVLFNDFKAYEDEYRG